MKKYPISPVDGFYEIGDTGEKFFSEILQIQNYEYWYISPTFKFSKDSEKVSLILFPNPEIVFDLKNQGDGIFQLEYKGKILFGKGFSSVVGKELRLSTSRENLLLIMKNVESGKEKELFGLNAVAYN